MHTGKKLEVEKRRLSCDSDALQVGSARSNSTRVVKVNRRKTNRRKTRPYCNCKQQRRSQWPRGLRRRSAAARLLRSWVRIPPGAWMFVCCECCVLSGRGFCDELITRPEESYRLWCVVACDL